ncbi:hypothetical protein OHB00_34320 [Streptomyces sp. NBC_00631]|uniref:hypothetical protein n=1 Tax=Streptomyces sp. NBC_00631 TaxID=2975793 RepID=UPI0030E16B37
MGLHRDGTRDFAYYADDWIWPRSRAALMKSTLLFFDGLALSLPQHLADRLIEGSPELAQPLAERGLLVNLEPDRHLQADTAARLATDLYEVMDRFHFALRSSSGSPRAIGNFHWGGARARLQANTLSQLMLARGIAEHYPSRLGNEERLLLISPAARLLILNAYCQALRDELAKQSDITLMPVADSVGTMGFYSPGQWDPRGRWRSSLHELRRAAEALTPGVGFAAAEIMTSDLHTLGVDVSAVPLEDIIAFRAEHREELRAYTAGVRTLLEITTDLSHQQYQAEMSARRERLLDEAAALQSSTRRDFGRMGVVTTLSVAAATWTGTQGDLVGALLAGLSAAAAVSRPTQPVTSYSYVLGFSRR